jgi:hypothetical protein
MALDDTAEKIIQTRIFYTQVLPLFYPQGLKIWASQKLFPVF